jgi:signal transduction histidine kinase
MEKTKPKIEKGTMRFRPRARLLYILGHELISDESIAILELVKNCYDADANTVTIRLIDVTNKQEGKIEIEDNGHGMTSGIIKKAWMEPARDNKKNEDGSRNRTKKYTRLPLGEKGVGRFSADKLGLRLEIVTRYCEFDSKTGEVSYLSPEETVVVIEGKKFIEDAYLDEIECTWETRVPVNFIGDKHGTTLRVSELRVDWNNELVRKTHLELSRLASPFKEAQDFELFFESNNFKEFNGKIENPLLENAPYSLEGSVNENGIMDYSLVILGTKTNGSKDLREEQEQFQIQNGKDISYRKPTCGPFQFNLYAFERDRSSWKKFNMDQQKVAVLTAIGGVSIYRDNFRVLPYGEKGNDWMNFDRRRVLNPGKILGNDRVIGYVQISHEINSQLRDKTNREGFIEEGLAFKDLRDLAVAAADFLGLERYNSQAHPKRSKAKIEEAKEDIDNANLIVGQTSSKAIAYLETTTNIDEGNTQKNETEKGKIVEELKTNIEATKKIAEGKLKLLEELSVSDEQIDTLISLSGIGLTAERMTHEFSRAIRKAEEQLQNSLGILRLESPTSEAIKKIEAAIGQLEIVRSGIRQMEPLYNSKKKYTELLDVGELAGRVERLFDNDCRDLDIKVTVTQDSSLELDIGKGHLIQVFSNLFDNSIYWLKLKPVKDGREIAIKISAKSRTIIFADNGKGVDEKIVNHLFNPFVTTKPDGRGLGLYIIQDILQNYKATIELMTEEKILSGANFKIAFPEDKH